MRRLALALIVPALTGCSDCPDPFDLSERRIVRPGAVVVLTAPDGELRVVGAERTTTMVVEARGCRSGPDPRIVPDSTAQASGLRVVARHADVRATVPAGVELIVRHGSGDVELRAVGPTALATRGGDVRVEQVIGGVSISAGPGTLYVREVMGDVEVVDGPGAIFVEGVVGGVRLRDGSGGIHLREIEGDVVVERDGAGGIDARGIGGDLDVQAKSDDLRAIRYSDVAGSVRLPER